MSTAKYRGDATRREKSLLFGRALWSLFPEPRYMPDTLTPTTAKNSLVVVVSSDKGLCGAINSFASKLARQVSADAAKAQGAAPGLVVIGSKSEAQLRRGYSKDMVKTIDENWKQPMNFATASGIASEILEASRARKSDEIALVYNSFKSMIKNDTVVLRIPHFENLLLQKEDTPAPLDKFELEPDSTSEAVQNLFEFAFASTLYGALMDNAAAEQSSRMTAMDNASKNAGDMIDRLLLQCALVASAPRCRTHAPPQTTARARPRSRRSSRRSWPVRSRSTGERAVRSPARWRGSRGAWSGAPSRAVQPWDLVVVQPWNWTAVGGRRRAREQCQRRQRRQRRQQPQPQPQRQPM